jgi:pimeloyl-ACP methyl ester carboxylesterase
VNAESPLRHADVNVNGVRLHVVEAGDGPPVVLLHGFPEFWYSWRHQIHALAAAGFRAVAPDQRGYNRSDKPQDVSSYRIDHLVEDVAALIRHLGAERAAVVGHDWGGVVAWKLAIARPELVERLVILNAPHPAAMRRELRGLGQLMRSWYVFFFQLPRLPEWFLRRNDFAVIRRTMRREPVRRGAFSPEDVRRYVEAFSVPGALTAALNWYRAALRYPSRPADDERPIRVPTLLIWGERDRYLGPDLSRGLGRWVKDLRVERFDASHWVQADEPDRVNRLMLDFLRGPRSGRP